MYTVCYCICQVTYMTSFKLIRTSLIPKYEICPHIYECHKHKVCCHPHIRYTVIISREKYHLCVYKTVRDPRLYSASHLYLNV